VRRSLRNARDTGDTEPRERAASLRSYGADKVHGESKYGAHRLPAGKTAAKECGAGVVLVRRRN